MRVFLSYAREDLAPCEKLAAALGERDIDVSWDRSLSPALVYSEQIREMIRTTDSFAMSWWRDGGMARPCSSEKPTEWAATLQPCD